MRRSFKLPPVGPAIPRHGGWFTRWLGRLLMRLARWRTVGFLPDIPKCVLIIAPHTSNWDFLVGLRVKWALSLRASFLAKHTLFRGPFGKFLDSLGGIPVDREAATTVAETAAARLQREARLWLVITPEGTRGAVRRWKTGFYRIAHQAGVPILPVAFDYGRREVRVFEPFAPSGDLEADLRAIQALYQDVTPRRASGVTA